MDAPVAAAAVEISGLMSPMSFLYTMLEDGSVVISAIVQSVDNGDGTFKAGDKAADITVSAEDIAGMLPEEEAE